MYKFLQVLGIDRCFLCRKQMFTPKVGQRIDSGKHMIGQFESLFFLILIRFAIPQCGDCLSLYIIYS